MFLSMFILLLLQGCYNIKEIGKQLLTHTRYNVLFIRKFYFRKNKKANQISLQNPVGFHAVLYKVNSTQTNGIYRQR